MSRAMRTVVSALAAIMGGTRTYPLPGTELRRPRVPSGDDGKQRLTTDEEVVCVYCEEYVEPGKGCSAKSSALLKGWKKLDEKHFLCPECREQQVDRR